MTRVGSCLDQGSYINSFTGRDVTHFIRSPPGAIDFHPEDYLTDFLYPGGAASRLISQQDISGSITEIASAAMFRNQHVRNGCYGGVGVVSRDQVDDNIPGGLAGGGTVALILELRPFLFRRHRRLPCQRLPCRRRLLWSCLSSYYRHRPPYHHYNRV